jgi:hypothetical protein
MQPNASNLIQRARDLITAATGNRSRRQYVYRSVCITIHNPTVNDIALIENNRYSSFFVYQLESCSHVRSSVNPNAMSPQAGGGNSPSRTQSSTTSNEDDVDAQSGHQQHYGSSSQAEEDNGAAGADDDEDDAITIVTAAQRRPAAMACPLGGTMHVQGIVCLATYVEDRTSTATYCDLHHAKSSTDY